MARYIKLYEQILDWEWFKDKNTFMLFVYLLLKANYCDLEFQGTVIKRGQLVTSLPKLATGSSLSIQQARTALKHLISTGEITSQPYHDYRVITIVKYDLYQGSTGKPTGKGPKSNRPSNSQSTDQLTPSIELSRTIELIENKNKSLTRFVVPTLAEISAYVQEIGSSVDPEQFFDYYEARGWELKPGQKMKDWKATVRTWERREKNGRNNRTDSSGENEKPKSKYGDLPGIIRF